MLNASRLSVDFKVEADSRYTFVEQHLCAAHIFAVKCAKIEATHQRYPGEEIFFEHRGYVTSAIMLSNAAVEAESSELTMHGPGNHLGSNGTDILARDKLSPQVKEIDRMPTVKRFEEILKILEKSPLDVSGKIYNDMKALVMLRNALIHFKSEWGKEMDGKNLVTTFKKLNLAKPGFIGDGTNYFPHQLLGADCAKWAVSTAINFLNEVSEHLGVESRLKRYRSHLPDMEV